MAEERQKLYYGWVIVAVMGVTGALTMAMGTLNYGLFIRPMGDDLGIGRATFGWAQTARQFASAGTSPLVGNWIDRHGSRALLAVAAAVSGGALFVMGFINAGWQLVALFTVMGLVGLAGPGALVTSVPVAKWFVRRRGLAMSCVALGIPAGGVLFIPLTQVLIDSYGWRNAWMIMGAGGAGVIVPLSLLFVRRQPEDLGLRPDGVQAPPPHQTAATAPRDERSWTRQEAMRTTSFWQLTVAFSLVGFALSTVAVHRIPHLIDRGLEPRLVAYATALDAVAAGVTTVVMGLYASRIPARFLGAAGFAIVTLAIYLTMIAGSTPVMFLAMITFGAGIGGLVLIQNYVWADYFGRMHLGSIRGVVMPITLIVGGFGAPLAGYIRDATGSYTTIWIAAMALFVAGTVLLVVSAPPKYHTAPEPLLAGSRGEG